MPRARFKNVNDMWKECVLNDKKLLSEYPGDFWAYYITNHVRFDALFRQMFLSFTYFLQDNDETLSTVTDNFIDAVYNHLLLNHKKYEEMYRIEVLEDLDYKFNKNYDVTESSTRTTEDERNDTIGSRTDTSSMTYGQRTDETTKVSGQRTDTETNVLGSREDSVATTEGERSDGTTFTAGTHTDTHEHDVSPDDSEDFFNHRKDTDVYGQRQDVTEFVKGEQEDSSTFNKGEETDTNTLVKGSETDTDTLVKGSETDSGSTVKGSQSNSSTTEGTETYAMTKSGIVGNITPAKLLEQHTSYWKLYEFYKYIFKKISEDLLMV